MNKTRRSVTCGSSSLHVREGGFEPPRPFGHWHLKPARLPFRHSRVKRAKVIPAPRVCPKPGRGSPWTGPDPGRRRPRYDRVARPPVGVARRRRVTPTGTTTDDRDGRRAAWADSRRLENKLEQMISGAFARAFRSAVQPVEIAAALQRECDNNAQILSRDRRLVPNDFHVELSQHRPGPAGAVRQRARRRPGPPAARPRRRAELRLPGAGEHRLRARPRTSPPAGSGSAAAPRPRSPATPPHTQVGRARAFLEVNGTRHPLQPPGLVVGRGTEADLRINDPGVSRRHIEFTVHRRRRARHRPRGPRPRLDQRDARRRPPDHRAPACATAPRSGSATPR